MTAAYTVPFDGPTVAGVHVSSRHGHQREVDTIIGALERMPPQARERIVFVRCDSKHGVYTIGMRKPARLGEPFNIKAADLPRHIAIWFEAGLKSVAPGHNGIVMVQMRRWWPFGDELAVLPASWWFDPAAA